MQTKIKLTLALNNIGEWCCLFAFFSTFIICLVCFYFSLDDTWKNISTQDKNARPPTTQSHPMCWCGWVVPRATMATIEICLRKMHPQNTFHLKMDFFTFLVFQSHWILLKVCFAFRRKHKKIETCIFLPQYEYNLHLKTFVCIFFKWNLQGFKWEGEMERASSVVEWQRNKRHALNLIQTQYGICDDDAAVSAAVCWCLYVRKTSFILLWMFFSFHFLSTPPWMCHSQGIFYLFKIQSIEWARGPDLNTKSQNQAKWNLHAV